MTKPVDHSVAHRRLRVVCTSFVLVHLLSSCAAPGTKVQVDRSSLTKLQRLGVTVTKDEEFSVRLARDQSLNIPAVNLGILGGLVLIGAAAAAVGLSSADARYADQFSGALKAFDPAPLFTEGLLRNLQSQAGFIAVNVPIEDKSAVRSKGLDAIVEINLKQWGLRRCGAPYVPQSDWLSMEQKAQASFYIETRIVSAAKGDAVWERNEFHLDSECLTLEELRSQGVLVRVLSRAIDYLSGKMANEIRFP